ncbi:YrhB family protein [Pseudoxanthomonas japonensis]|nr:YrhB family protein [Pseudoxanthomonas japonensis]
MKTDIESALKVALVYLKELEVQVGEELVVTRFDEIAERGWLFFYNTDAYCKGGGFSHALVGNGPIFVAYDGQLIVLSAAGNWGKEIEDFDRRRKGGG